MEADDRTHELLQEIRDAQREHLAEYRRVTRQSLELQQRVVDRQEQIGLIYKRIVVLGGILVAALLSLLLYLLVHWSRYLFRWRA
jgi:ferric-dicitrate binding protein FerR (iron transport regulator)